MSSIFVLKGIKWRMKAYNSFDQTITVKDSHRIFTFGFDTPKI